ncbi:MAG: PEP-utilizing enzyme [Nanoarchaeota archaeon]|nr:PEP-utilizing enzyme [Nanoarchaeota archaeon]
MKKLEGIGKIITRLMENEDRKDVEFRYAIVSSEIGDIARYITHDQVLNPSARPHGTKEDEALAYGQALVQLIALAQMRDVHVANALEKGLENWEAADWRKVKAQGKGVEGTTACYGCVRGSAYVAFSKEDLNNIPEHCVLVVPYATPGIASYLDKVMACVADHGGKTCHLASVAREKNVICIVGTGNATSVISSGNEIFVDATKERGKIHIEE